MGFGGFSWKRAIGYTKAKTRLSRKVGIPFTRSGRERKLGGALYGNIFGVFVGNNKQKVSCPQEEQSFTSSVMSSLWFIFVISVILLILTPITIKQLSIIYSTLVGIYIAYILSTIKTCINCKSKKTTNKCKVCNKCQISIRKEGEEFVKYYKRIIDMEENQNNLTTLKKNYDKAIELGNEMLVYDDKNLEVFNYTIAELLKQIEEKKEKIVSLYFQKEHFKTKTKSSAATTLRGKIGPYERFMACLYQYQNELPSNDYNYYISDSKKTVIDINMNLFKEKIRLAELNNRKKNAENWRNKAIVYIETLNFNISEVEKKQLLNTI